MFSFIKNLFFKDSSTLDKVLAGIDKAVYTKEEKAIAVQQYLDSWLAFQTIIQNESTPTAKSRRYLAFMIIGSFLGMLFLGISVSHSNPEYGKIIFEQAGKLTLLVEAVGATYFLKDLVVKAISANKQ